MNWLFLLILLLVLVGCRSPEAVVTETPFASATPTLPIGVSLVTRAVPTTEIKALNPGVQPQMTFQLTNISAVLFLTTLLNLFTTGISWQRRRAKSGAYFAWGMVAITFWTFFAGLGYAAATIPLKLFFAKLEYLGNQPALALFAMTTLSYANFDDWLEKSWVKAIFITAPALNTLLAWTNGSHHWLWTHFTWNPRGDNVLIFHHGPAFIWTILLGYAFIAIILVSLWRAAYKGSTLVRRQARILLVATLLAVVSNAVYLLNIPVLVGIDWTSIAFSLTGFFFLIALYGTQFLDIVPIARYAIIERMGDALLVLDAQDHLVDFNQASRALFQIDPHQLGGAIQAVMAHQPAVLELITHPQPEAEITVTLADPLRILNGRLTQLTDHRGQPFGKLIIFRNITELYQAQQALRASEERYRTVADYTYDWEYWQAPNGHIRYMSPACQRMTGYGIDEFVAAPRLLTEIVLNEDRHLLDQHAAIVTAEPLPNTPHQAEFRIRRRDGEIRWIAHTCQAIYTPDGENLGLRANNRDVTDVKLAEEKLRQTTAQLAVLEERQRLAHDLHDSVTQSIHSLTLFSETLTAVLEKSNIDRALYIAGRLQESARQSLKEVRLLLYQLQPSEEPAEAIHLLNDLELRLNRVERRAGIQAELVVDGDLGNRPPEWHKTIFWIIIEALNNVLKHAQAKEVSVLIRCQPQGTFVEVRDNGRGFEMAALRAGGLGLHTMRERAELLGGDLRIVSAPQEGTCVSLTIPQPPG